MPHTKERVPVHQGASSIGGLSTEQIAKASTEELKRELCRSLKVTSEYLRYMATIWAELQRRGEDLSEFKTGVGHYLSQIASEKVLPELVVDYFGEPGVVRRLAALPLEEQKEVAASKVLPWQEKSTRTVEPARKVKSRGSDEREVSLEKSAAVGGPKDVAEMLLGLILKSSSPGEVSEILVDLLADHGFINVVD